MNFQEEMILPFIPLVKSKISDHKGFFITGTDTGVGKTFVTCLIMQAFKQEGLRVIGIKPIASGSTFTQGTFQHPDALLLQQHSNIALPYSTINPFAFEPAIAPHLAAAEVGCRLSVTLLHQSLQPALQQSVDCHVIEGAGGWLVPLNETETLADLAIKLNFPVILVVGLKLGCLNHALLTAASLQQMNVPCGGWVANFISPRTSIFEKNIETLIPRIPFPLLAVVDHHPMHENAQSQPHFV